MILEYICGPSIQEVLTLSVINFVINIITLTIVLLKKPIKVIDERNLTDLR
jgi:hypothetical protein|tara:strand:+ start:1766 stop:1918 length:153 start_codon:yes stop_codon:yes gene_type:complete